MGFDPHDYSEFALELKFWSIKSEHVYYDMMFIKKVNGNLIAFKKIVSLFQERTVNYWFRDHRPILETGSAKDYVRYSAVNRIRRKFNKLHSQLRSIDRIFMFKLRIRGHIGQYK